MAYSFWQELGFTYDKKADYKTGANSQYHLQLALATALYEQADAPKMTYGVLEI